MNRIDWLKGTFQPDITALSKAYADANDMGKHTEFCNIELLAFAEHIRTTLPNFEVLGVITALENAITALETAAVDCDIAVGGDY